MKETLFLRLVDADDKAAGLAELVTLCQKAEIHPDAYLRDPESFSVIPNRAFCYWFSDSVFDAFSRLPKVGDHYTVRSGSVTFDDFQFLRGTWEIPASAQVVDSRILWQPIPKGGEFSAFYADVHLLINWKDDGNYVAQHVYEHRPREGYGWGSRGRNLNHFGRPSVNWSRRSQKGFSARVLPSGMVFSDKSPVAQHPEEEMLWFFLGIANSAVFRGLLQAQIAFGSYEVGATERTPFPAFRDDDLVRSAAESFKIKQRLDSASELSHVFTSPSLLQVTGLSISNRYSNWHEQYKNFKRTLNQLQREIDERTCIIYGINEQDREIIGNIASVVPVDQEPDNESGEEGGESCDGGSEVELAGQVTALVSYLVGCVIGRWDVRLATGERPIPELPHPFAPLTVYSPGMLLKKPCDYSLTIDRDGILPDDPNHLDDIVRHIHEVFSVIWRDNTEGIEQETCTILGVKHLRDYFRKTAAAGFFADHIARYSKSRRKAPIYWLLQSSKKNYALWLYYHKLDKDRLFKALVNFVEPKIRLEDGRLETLRHQKATWGDSGKDAKRFAKEVERQEDFLSELRDFGDKLRRAANLHLEPDLNDGVVLNIAPLHELVPWKEAKGYWEELLEGK